MTKIDAAIVGGGISGLIAARTLCAGGLRVRLFERESGCGGVIQTERLGEFVVDAGPDTLLAHKPAALLLVKELGLEDDLIAPLPRRTTFVVRGTTLRSLPETSALGLPTTLRTVAGATAFSWRGKLRMAAEPFIPASPATTDESIGSFVGRRFGREAVNSVAEPVLAGLYRGDVDRLSIRALFPALANAERTHGSVARAWRAMPPRTSAGGSMSLRGGLRAIVARLEQQLPCGVVRTGAEVQEIERRDAYSVRLTDGSAVSARAVLLATPAYVSAALCRHVDPTLSELCGSIRYVTSVNVALGYSRDRVQHPLEGWGFVVPRAETRRLRSASWVSSKWPDRAPAGHALIRASLGSAAAPSFQQADDRTLIGWAHEELSELLGISARPVVARVYRRPGAMPQLEVGHLEKMAAIDRRLASLPGLFVSASGFRGIGLPDCIGDARAVAGELDRYLREAADSR